MIMTNCRLCMALTAALCLIVACSSSHPASSVQRVMLVLTGLKRLEDKCYVEKGRYCSLQELRLTDLRKWGDLRILSSSTASFEDWDLQLLRTNRHYCTVAFPTRISGKFSSEWRDDRGRAYWTAYPWRDIPRACDMPERPKLIVE